MGFIVLRYISYDFHIYNHNKKQGQKVKLKDLKVLHESHNLSLEEGVLCDLYCHT